VGGNCGGQVKSRGRRGRQVKSGEEKRVEGENNVL
jgi:hypothetical protein